MAGEDDQIQGQSGQEEKIFVSVRLRPLNEKEISRNDVSDWECVNDTTIIYRNHLSISERSMYPSAYSFDRVFSADCSTRQVYEEGAKSVALSVIGGVNASVFAYGQTSSGKTYTMSGITDYTIADIYDYIQKHKEREFTLKFSAMEIYNESVRDLLSTDSSPLRLLDDPEKGTVVEKLTEETLRDWNHFKELLSVCEAQRQIGETALNEVSSRSHQILRLTIESSAREFLANDKLSALAATVNFIDLAGSERASQSLSAGTRLKEGCHINRSLLTLGTVIRKLSKGKTGHIPFRDSKLTRILQSSLGGNARTAIICTMSPARIHVEQSRNTLLFASCAKEVTTNAQVNVVMSDKALVKHLQRELARLESELRSPGRATVASDTAVLLREKDLEIEKLKKEILELTAQLVLAHSQIEDLHQMVGEEKLSIESVDMKHQYPKLRVRNAWSLENLIPESPVSAEPSYQDIGVESSNTSPYSNERSPVSSDENFFQLSDFKVNFQPTCPPQQLSVSIPEEEDEIYQPPDENFEDLCKEVRCIEMEKPSIKRYPDSNASDCSPNKYEILCAPLSVADDLKPIEVVTEDKVKEVNNTSFPAKEESEPNRTPRRDVLSPEKPSQQLLSKDICTRRRTIPNADFVDLSPGKHSPWPLEKGTSTLRGLKLMRSKSCRAALTAAFSLPWFEIDEKNGSTPTNWFEKGFIGRPENIQAARIALLERFSMSDLPWFEKEEKIETTPSNCSERNFSARLENVESTLAVSQDDLDKKMLSPNDSQAFASDASVFELEAQNVKGDFAPAAAEVTRLQHDKQIAHHPEEETSDKKSMMSAKSVKDVALDPIQDCFGGPLARPLEFKRLQREIIELWHACNVSLAHRTYFFILFKDHTDSIYLEVEHRRLSFIKQSFSRGRKTVEDGRTLTPTSSMRGLNRERYKLSQQMKKKLSTEDRENLFLRWGIGLSTKHRRLQLSHRLWSDIKDMEHIRESASVVAKLLGFVDPDPDSKEMFGINFALRHRMKRSSLWKRSMRSLSIV